MMQLSSRVTTTALCFALPLCGVAAPHFAQAATLLVAPEFQVNTYTTNAQFGPTARSVARSADGSFVVVWQSFGQDGNSLSVHGQRYDAAGAATGTEFQVNTYTRYAQQRPAVSAAADGSFVVVWQSSGQDGSSSSVHGQRYDATGAPDGTEFRVNSYTTNDQTLAAVSSAADGSFVVVWQSLGQDGSFSSVHGQRYDSTGAPDGTEFRANTYTTNAQYLATVSAAADGSFVVVWQSSGQDGSAFSVHGRRYDATGTAVGPEFRVNTYTTASQSRPAVSSAADGSFVVVWQSYGQDGSYSSVHGQRYDAAGTAAGTEFQVNTYTPYGQQRPAVSADADGSFVVVWQSYGQLAAATTTTSLPASTTTTLPPASTTTLPPASTTTLPPASTTTMPPASTTTMSLPASTTTTLLPASTTTTSLPAPGFGVYGQRYDATGAADGTEFQVNTYTTGNQYYSTSIASDGAGNFVVVWFSEDQDDGVDGGMFGQLLCVDANLNGLCDSGETTTTTTTTMPQASTTTTMMPASTTTTLLPASTTTTLPPASTTTTLPPASTTTTLPPASTTTTLLPVTTTTMPVAGNCAPAPEVTCIAAAQAKLDFNERNAGNEKMKLQWKKISAPTVQGDFGDPVAGNTSVAICLYNDSDTLVQEFSVDRAGLACASKACWKAKGTKGYRYKDKDVSADGVAKLGFKSGDADKGKADTKGGNRASRGQSSLPIGIPAALTGNTAPTVQMVTSDGLCVTATMNEVKRDEATHYSAQRK